MKSRIPMLLSIVSISLTAHLALAADEGVEDVLVVVNQDGSVAHAVDAAGNEVAFLYDESTGEFLATIDQDGVVIDWRQLFAESDQGGEQ